MSLSIHQMICDARRLVGRLSEHENTADNLITEMQSVCNQIDYLKQYQEDVDILNEEAKQPPRDQLIPGIQQEMPSIKDIKAENKELRNTVEDYQNALELIMSKYRRHTSALMKNSKIDFSALYNSRYANIITSQAEKINEMTAVMRVAASMDEENELKYKENYTQLKEENNVLREILEISKQYGSINHETIKNIPAAVKELPVLDKNSEYKDNNTENDEKNNVTRDNSFRITIEQKSDIVD